MTHVISSSDVVATVTTDLALQAMRSSFRAEGNGGTNLPRRLDANSATGFFRVMPAILDNVMGCKIMTLAKDKGTRYLIVLYSVETGACLALVDGDVLTKTRTAATTALGGMHMLPEPPTSLSIIGTGFEARGHLEFLAEIWPIESVWVYSRSPENRRLFASSASEALGLDVRIADSADEAVSATNTILLATRSETPVIDGRALQPGSIVLSIGSTRPDLRELDGTTLARAKSVVVDAIEQVYEDSGDLIHAREHGLISKDTLIPLSELVVSNRILPRANGGGAQDITVFKSAGTALQDLALAQLVFEEAKKSGRGLEVPDVSQLKPFT